MEENKKTNFSKDLKSGIGKPAEGRGVWDREPIAGVVMLLPAGCLVLVFCSYLCSELLDKNNPISKLKIV